MGGRSLVSLWTQLAAVAILAASAAPQAWSEAEDPIFGGVIGNDGALIEANRRAAEAAVRAGEKAGVTYRYSSVSFCAEGPEDYRADFYCAAAIRECENNTPEQGLGPANRIFRQEQGAATWEFRGVTCFPNLVDDGPQLTMAMILEAFHDTRFAVPEITTEPKGDVTLVTLPTYYQVVWPDVGFAPEQVDTTNLLGFTVEIRPRLDSLTYHFGDGATAGPTKDLGGPYPNGAITHAYERKGTFDARVDITYGGQFRVNGGQWSDIPGSTTITGSSTPVTVMESRARLVTGND